MRERIEFTKGFTGSIRDQLSSEFDSRMRSVNLFENQRARRIIDLSIRGVDVDPIPPSLEEGKSAILASNYPSITRTTRAVLKVGCRLPGEEARLGVIARKEVITKANWFLKTLGVDKIVFPAQKDETGIYRLKGEAYKEILKFLSEPGNILWLSVTGETRGDGLLEEDLRTGVYIFSLKSQVPIVPMGVVTKEKRGKRRVAAVKLGEPINPPNTKNLTELEKSDYSIDYTKLVMCQIAALLPPGQRGSFENLGEKLEEINKRLKTYPI